MSKKESSNGSNKIASIIGVLFVVLLVFGPRLYNMYLSNELEETFSDPDFQNKLNTALNKYENSSHKEIDTQEKSFHKNHYINSFNQFPYNTSFIINFPYKWEIKDPITQGNNIVKKGKYNKKSGEHAYLNIYYYDSKEIKKQGIDDISMFNESDFFKMKYDQYTSNVDIINSGMDSINNHIVYYNIVKFDASEYHIDYYFIIDDGLLLFNGQTISFSNDKMWFIENKEKILESILSIEFN